MLGSTLRWMLVAVVGGAMGLGALGGMAHAQTPDDAARGPRFLVAPAATSRAAPLDVSRTPVLQQRIALDLRGVTLKDALALIAQKAGVSLAYTEDVVPLQRRVNLQADGITVAAALTDLLVGMNVDVVFLPEGRAVVRPRSEAVLLPSGTVHGRITDARTAAGIAAVEVFLEGRRGRTMTDSNGAYRIGDADTGTYVLTVRRLGYTKHSRRVAVREGRDDVVNVALEPAAARLDELVTTATGVQRRRDLGNAITTIQVDSVMQAAPIRNLTDLLETRVPGLTVRHTSGAPGDPARLRLRGLGSVRRSNDPVVVVDGIRVYAAQSGARGGNLANNSSIVGFAQLPAPSPLDQIDPNSIEKIEVFKGPSAATLYGADAANGVIVITTKKGRPGPARWDATFTYGRTNTVGQYPTGYYRWGHSIEHNGPVLCTTASLVYDITNSTGVPCVPDSLVQYQALNDPNFTMLGQGRRVGGSVTVSGGSQALTYSVTGSYTDETGLLHLPTSEVEHFRTLMGHDPPGWMQRPHQYTTWSATSSVRAVLGPTADVTLTTSLARSEQERTSLEEQVAVLAGTYVDRVNGTYYVPGNPNDASQALKSTANLLQNYSQRTTASALTVTTGLNAGWRPRSWFGVTSQAGFNLTPRLDERFQPVGPPGFGSDSGALVRGTGRSLVSTLDLQGTFRKPLGGGFRFETSAGVNFTTQRTDDITSSAIGLVPGTSSLSGARNFLVTDDQASSSVFGWYLEPRLMGERLSLSAGIRLDGGSAYGARVTQQSGGLFGLLSLPKLNGSWVISGEPWFPFKTMFSLLRLRGAYGQAQVQPGPVDRLRLYQRSTVDQHFVLNALGNTELKPERSTEVEGGFDADVFDSRLSLELTLYRKTQHDALLPVTLPGSVNGGGTVLTNIGTIRNAGLELSTRLTPVRGPTTWTVELIYSRNTNLLVELGDGVAPNPAAGLVAGYPVGGRWDKPIVGFADRNGDGVLQLSEIKLGDSAVYLGRLLPKSQTALHTSLALWGGAITLVGSLSYDAGATQIDQTARTNWVLARALVDPSAPLDKQAAALASTYTNPTTNYGLTAEVSTLRFQALSVRYRAPTAFARFLRAKELSFAVQGDNLGLHSTYQGKDPDVTAWDAGERIVDTGQLTQPRTWQLTFSLRY